MEAKTIVAFQGKSFKVSLQSMLGSTNYGWCLASMPQGVVFAGLEIVPTTQGIGPVNQVFYFGTVDVPENPDVILLFKLLCLSDYSKPASDEIEINVQLLPYNKDNADSNSFVQYSENSAVYNSQMPYGFVLSNPVLKYGYPCGDTEAVKYGYPCASDTNLKYGYPCGVDSVLKYGYPCADDANLKYGYPCGVEATLKYGYPCTNAKYGYPDCK
jgi:hypothetical protein